MSARVYRAAQSQIQEDDIAVFHLCSENLKFLFKIITLRSSIFLTKYLHYQFGPTNTSLITFSVNFFLKYMLQFFVLSFVSI
jgi:hypothetical protein